MVNIGVGYVYLFECVKKKAETKEEVSFDVESLLKKAKRYKRVIWYNK